VIYSDRESRASLQCSVPNFLLAVKRHNYRQYERPTGIRFGRSI